MMIIILLCCFLPGYAEDNTIEITDDSGERNVTREDETFSKIYVRVAEGEDISISVGSVVSEGPDLDYGINVDTEDPAVSIETAGDVSVTSFPSDWNFADNTAVRLRSDSGSLSAGFGGDVKAESHSVDPDFDYVKAEAMTVSPAPGNTAEVTIKGTASASADGSFASGEDPSLYYETYAHTVMLLAYEGAEADFMVNGVTADAKGNDFGLTEAIAADICAGDEESDLGDGKASFTSKGDVTAAAESEGEVNVTAASLYSGSQGSSLDFTVEEGVLHAEAAGTEGTVYGLYAFADGGVVNAMIGGNVTQESSIADSTLGGSAAIVTRGSGGTLNIQVGAAVTDTPPAALVSGSDTGIFNYSGNELEKNIVIWGKLSGGTAAVLSDEDFSPDNFNLAVWEIEPKEIGGAMHSAASRVNQEAVSDSSSETIENSIRYIILIDPESADKVKLEGAQEGTDLKGETYYWANLGDEVKLVSAVEGYHVSKAFRDVDKSKALTCDGESCSFEVPVEGAIWLSAELAEDPEPTEEPTEEPTGEPTAEPTGEPTPEPTPGPDQCACVWCCRRLPPTGFSSLWTTALSEQPKELSYKPTRMLLQIPSLDVETELVTVPLTGDAWPVEWLGDRAGVLEGSALPGKGISLVAAHNTLNDTEFGPFALLNSLEVNDLVTVSGEHGSVQTFRVYANELLGTDDMRKVAAIAGQEANSLVLVTCENESVEGGYLNRRVVFAKPN